jgi:MoxR-like ATPase
MEGSFLKPLRESIGQAIVGQVQMVEHVLIGLLTGGHVLLEGVPGLAKTRMVHTLAQSVSAKFQRIQFTPDLLPADLIGTVIYNPEDRSFGTKKGPIFANLILADEINRAPAKVQSALLEAMQERQVTLGDTTHQLPELFLVLATQNPIEQEGTYPLPEAQVDRFMLKVLVEYPSLDEEREILDRIVDHDEPVIEPQLDCERLLAARETVRMIYLDPKLKDYIVQLVHATRSPAEHGLQSLTPLIQFGSSPRGTISLARASRAHAFLRGRGYVIPEDIKSVGYEVLRHRVILSYEAEAEEVTPDDVVRQVFEAVEVP